jgi:hypothetical protein
MGDKMQHKISLPWEKGGRRGRKTEGTDCHVASLLAMTGWRHIVISYEGAEESDNK